MITLEDRLARLEAMGRELDRAILRVERSLDGLARRITELDFQGPGLNANFGFQQPSSPAILTDVTRAEVGEGASDEEAQARRQGFRAVG